MEIGRFRLCMSFLGRLYRLITWQGSFNSGPGPVYFGMGRISLWAELLFGQCPNSLHKVEVWAYTRGLRFGPVHILFSTPSVASPALG